MRQRRGGRIHPRPGPLEDPGPDESRSAGLATIIVEKMATEMAVEVTGDGLRLHGGNGYTTERQVERHGATPC